MNMNMNMMQGRGPSGPSGPRGVGGKKPKTFYYKGERIATHQHQHQQQHQQQAQYEYIATVPQSNLSHAQYNQPTSIPVPYQQQQHLQQQSYPPAAGNVHNEKVSIPSQYAPKVLNPQSLNSITSQTGCTLEVHEPQPPFNVRVITLRGSPQACNNAKYVIRTMMF
mmetsp:Transcript_2144/g.2756  ORF Transcript_2144/g.2756 Transcript_2144/m.2756 type:complete len:166 (+) Transcript_2144:3-500(+)